MRKIILASLLAVLACSCDDGIGPDGKWTAEKANKWYKETGWRSGCDYIPASAINQIEMWQSSTFDPETIDRELGWMEEIGFTTARVYLSSVVWRNEPEAFKAHIDEFLSIAQKHGITPLLVFFDDCHQPESAFGVQPEPKPGVHNSGWVRDPAHSLRADTLALYPVLEAYVKDVMTSFKNDRRILWWDLYNEPGGNGYDLQSFPLLKNVFKWAREVRPSQPVSVGVWYDRVPELNAFQVENSDIISYHDYREPELHAERIAEMKAFGRPVICTEYMARTRNSTFFNTLPMLKENNVSAINWGFVFGKSNTIYAWREVIPDGSEPEIWFHDIYRRDKTPFDPAEIELIRKVNGK